MSDKEPEIVEDATASGGLVEEAQKFERENLCLANCHKPSNMEMIMCDTEISGPLVPL